MFWPNMEELPVDERNTLRMIFLDPDAKTLYYDLEAVARMAVAAFRADVARAGATAEVSDMVDELSRSSPAFKKMWQNNDVSDSAHAMKDLCHPVLGTISFECTTFGVDGRQDLTMLVFVPASPEFAARIATQIKLPR